MLIINNKTGTLPRIFNIQPNNFGEGDKYVPYNIRPKLVQTSKLSITDVIGLLV